MGQTKEDAEKSAKENWNLARRFDESGDKASADAARQRAVENEKERDSWLYRFFGW